MAVYPSLGSTNWYNPLRGFIEDTATEAVAAGGLVPSSSALTLAGPTNVIPSITSTLSEWTVTGDTAVTLPADFPVGGQHTIHVTEGLSRIAWPGGTVLYGGTAADEAWITLIRTDDGWTVLIPDIEPPSALRDTGWVTVASGTSDGTTVTYDAGFSAADWTFTAGTPHGEAGTPFPWWVDVRRIGNRVILATSRIDLADFGGGAYGLLMGPQPEAGWPRAGFDWIRYVRGGNTLNVPGFQIAYSGVLSGEPTPGTLSGSFAMITLTGTAAGYFTGIWPGWDTDAPWPVLP